jgi:hypothetical protein
VHLIEYIYIALDTYTIEKLNVTVRYRSEILDPRLLLLYVKLISPQTNNIFVGGQWDKKIKKIFLRADFHSGCDFYEIMRHQLRRRCGYVLYCSDILDPWMLLLNIKLKSPQTYNTFVDGPGDNYF